MKTVSYWKAEDVDTRWSLRRPLTLWPFTLLYIQFHCGICDWCIVGFVQQVYTYHDCWYHCSPELFLRRQVSSSCHMDHVLLYCRINGALSYIKKQLNYRSSLSAEIWEKNQIGIFFVSSKQFSWQRVNDGKIFDHFENTWIIAPRNQP